VGIQEGADERSIPGNTIAVQGNMPFTGLTKFGGAFLSKFECSQMPHPVSSCQLSLNVFMVCVKAFDKSKYESQGGLMESSVATVVGASYFC
jgi:hypothetical protein